MNGKGSKSRITNRSQFRENYSEIDWGRDKDPEKEVPQRIPLKVGCTDTPEGTHDPDVR